MPHTLGLSGSITLSDPEKFPQLFTKEKITHIEIGEFPDEASFHHFLKHLGDAKDMTFGIHSPLVRNQSKNDLIEKVQVEPEVAWQLFAAEVKHVAKLGAEYILVHFPYFKGETEQNTDEMIENGLKRLQRLQEDHAISIVCEPKLGYNRSPFGIDALNSFPIETWENYGIKLCIDIGDYLLAKGDQAKSYLTKWKHHIKVVHLHNVTFNQGKYIWTPVHPSHETNPDYFQVKKLIEQLSDSPDVFFVFEHTPHTNPSDTFVNEGIIWVHDIIN